MAKYSKKTQEHVEKTMHRKKKGTLKSGSGEKVKSSKQAIAIALSEAREKGYKAPKKGAKKPAAKKASTKTKNSSAKKSTAKKSAKKASTTRSKAAKKGAKKSGRKSSVTKKKSTSK